MSQSTGWSRPSRPAVSLAQHDGFQPLRYRRSYQPKQVKIMRGRYNVLFLCTGNSAIMAEAILNFKGRTNFTAYSAGSHPSGAVRQEALRQLEAAHIPTAGLRSKLWDEFSTGEEPRAKSRKPAASGWQLSYFLPSLFCAITN